MNEVNFVAHVFWQSYYTIKLYVLLSKFIEKKVVWEKNNIEEAFLMIYYGWIR